VSDENDYDEEQLEDDDSHGKEAEFHNLTDAGILAVLKQMESLGYDPTMIDPTTLSESGYCVVVADGLGGVLICDDCDTAVRIGPLPWLDPEHWLIVESWILQDRDLRELMTRADEIAEMYGDYRGMLKKNFETKVQPPAERVEEGLIPPEWLSN